MMNTTLRHVRAAAIAAIFAMVSASAVDAQHHKGKQGGGTRPNAAPAAKPQAKAMPHQQPSSMKSEHHDTNGNHRNPSNESLVSSLHSTMAQLARTDHHYNGRRAQAVREINTAVKLLSPQAGPSNTALAQSGNIRRVPPATSDAYLREAQKSLLDLEAQMDISGINPHKFIQAKASVQNAIRELNLALNDL
jgi:hypothetical protein